MCSGCGGRSGRGVCSAIPPGTVDLVPTFTQVQIRGESDAKTCSQKRRMAMMKICDDGGEDQEDAGLELVMMV